MVFGVQWYLWLLLLFAIVGAVILWIKALSASKARRERMKKEAAIWKRDYDLRQGFSVLTEDKLRETESAELLHGVAMNIQVYLEGKSNMNEAFAELPIEKQYIYALEYFDEDAKLSLSTFYKNNDKPLTPLIPHALTAIGADDYIPLLLPVAEMYDEDNEVSLDQGVIANTDAAFSEIYDSTKLCKLAAEYIKKNKQIFLS